MSSCYEFNCYGCRRLSDTPVCYLCTCKQCENILSYGTCLKCNSGIGNSFTYDQIPEYFDEVQIIPDPPPQCHFNIYLCQICKSNSHYGYECSQRVPLIYEPEPCYIQNFSDNDYSQYLPSVNPLIDHHCCYKCGNSLHEFFCRECTCEFYGNGAHVGYICPAQVPSFQTLPSFPQQYSCYEDCGVLPKADHYQPPQYTVNHPIFNAHNDFLNSQNKITIAQNKLMEQITSMCEMFESDEFIKSSVENLVPNPSESEGKNGCDVHACFTTFSNVHFDVDYEFDSSDDQSLYDEDTKSSSTSLNSLLEETHIFHNSLPGFTTFSNVLFDVDHDSDSSDDQSLSDDDVPKKIYSNPLFDEEIIPMEIDPHSFNVESDLIESMPNNDYSIIIPSKIDSLFDEFAGELTLLKSILPGIDETDCHLEEEICLTKRLLYDNSSPRPPEE
nr:hypothetical protein [Tanacetum cinerariifolium]